MCFCLKDASPVFPFVMQLKKSVCVCVCVGGGSSKHEKHQQSNTITCSLFLHHDRTKPSNECMYIFVCYLISACLSVMKNQYNTIRKKSSSHLPFCQQRISQWFLVFLRQSAVSTTVMPRDTIIPSLVNANLIMNLSAVCCFALCFLFVCLCVCVRVCVCGAKRF